MHPPVAWMRGASVIGSLRVPLNILHWLLLSTVGSQSMLLIVSRVLLHVCVCVCSVSHYYNWYPSVVVFRLCVFSYLCQPPTHTYTHRPHHPTLRYFKFISCSIGFLSLFCFILCSVKCLLVLNLIPSFSLMFFSLSNLWRPWFVFIEFTVDGLDKPPLSFYTSYRGRGLQTFSCVSAWNTFVHPGPDMVTFFFIHKIMLSFIVVCVGSEISSSLLVIVKYFYFRNSALYCSTSSGGVSCESL